MENKDFYKAFEDAHRGSRATIRKRVSVYLPFVTHLKEVYPRGLALDIGCGRGEWLELLKENDISAKGVDLDKGMLSACEELGLNTTYGNGIEYLKEQADESHMLVTTFHVVEHISFEDLQTLVKESLRILKPGGLLIMETPNPENIKVGTEHFYLDPTHVKPIPSQLLSFLPDFCGYERTKVLRLQEAQELAIQDRITLHQVLGGVSPDYSVVAQKSAGEDILGQFNEVFSRDFGVSFDTLVNKFENRLQLLEGKYMQAEERYQKVIQSSSWRVTRPLRVVLGLAHRIVHAFNIRRRPQVVINATLENDNQVRIYNDLKQAMDKSDKEAL